MAKIYDFEEYYKKMWYNNINSQLSESLGPFVKFYGSQMTIEKSSAQLALNLISNDICYFSKIKRKSEYEIEIEFKLKLAKNRIFKLEYLLLGVTLV